LRFQIKDACVKLTICLPRIMFERYDTKIWIMAAGVNVSSDNGVLWVFLWYAQNGIFVPMSMCCCSLMHAHNKNLFLKATTHTGVTSAMCWPILPQNYEKKLKHNWNITETRIFCEINPCDVSSNVIGFTFYQNVSQYFSCITLVSQKFHLCFSY
jgi:hypothetical protein